MTPKEKFKRLNNPKTVEDYGLSLNEDELSTFEEGMAIVREIKQIQHRNSYIDYIATQLAHNAKATIDKKIYGCVEIFTNSKHK